jgi:CheY-like chemotaxis protein
LELTRRIKQDAELKTTRVIITSSLQEIGYAQAASAAGCDDNLFLPSVPEEVADAVWRAITHPPHHAEEEIQVERLGDL